MSVPKRKPGDGDWLWTGWFTTRWTEGREIAEMRTRPNVIELDHLIIVTDTEPAGRKLAIPGASGDRFYIHKDLIDG